MSKPINILLVGAGIREHAIAKSIMRSKHPHQLYGFSQYHNPGIMPFYTGLQTGSLHELQEIASFAKENMIDLAIVNSEIALAAGVTDALRQIGISTIGPSQKFIAIQHKDFMQSLNLPIPYSDHLHTYEQHFSFSAITDGIEIKMLPMIQTYQMITPYDDSLGLTANVMSVTQSNHRLNFLAQSEIDQLNETMEYLLTMLYAHFHEPYVGIIQGDFTKNSQGIAWQCWRTQLAIPGAINLMALMENDFIEICQALIQQTFSTVNLQFSPLATASQLVVPGHVSLDTYDVSHLERLYFGAMGYASLGVAENLEIAKQQADSTCKQVCISTFEVTEY